MNGLTVPTTKKVFSVASSNHRELTFLPLPTNLSLEEKITLLLLRDLVRLGWTLKSNSRRRIFEFVPPENYNKEIVQNAMAYARNDVLAANKDWIRNHLPAAQKHLASGKSVLSSTIQPRIEICERESQHNLFRMFRYFWSSPYSEYVGRRMRLIIRDDGIEGSPIIGIAALGSSIIHIPDRDNWIGWNTKTRTERIVYIMDAYVLGALPPYNALLGGKLISYILASNEVRELFKNKYKSKKTLINQREASELVLIVTSSLYGKNSSQYNRLKYNDELLYQPIGTTAGFGTLHISNETFSAMKALVEKKGHSISYKFGDGPNWRMRVIHAACSLMDLDGDIILRHSFKRGLYALPLANNWRPYLLSQDDKPEYKNLPMNDLVEYWKSRWLKQRRNQEEIMSNVHCFEPSDFSIQPTVIS